MAFLVSRALRRRPPMSEKSLDDDDFGEPDPEEQELIHFERHCRLLDTSKFQGIKQVQVALWLLFEDASSSLAAKARPGGLAPPAFLHPASEALVPDCLSADCQLLSTCVSVSCDGADCADYDPAADSIFDVPHHGAVDWHMQICRGQC